MTDSVTQVSQVPGPKILLIGPIGGGKTYSIRTLIEAGLKVGAVFTEPGMEGVSDIPTDKLAWHYIAPSAPDWKDMIDSAKQINTLPFKMLAELSDINKKKYTEFIDLLNCLSNFKDDRTGTVLGPVDDWGHDRVLFLDSLSGINIMAMNLMVGSKPVKSMADWGVAMDNLERFITRLTTSLTCPVVLTAHPERETDEVAGGANIMASTLGKKLAPKIPRFFSDVIYVTRNKGDFYWSTSMTGADLKTRNLPLGEKLTPSFVPLFAEWRKRTGVTV